VECKAYPSDAELGLVAPYSTLTAEDAPQYDYSLREVFNGLRWTVRSGSSPCIACNSSRWAGSSLSRRTRRTGPSRDRRNSRDRLCLSRLHRRKRGRWGRKHWNQARSGQTPSGERRLCAVAASMGDLTKLRLPWRAFADWRVTMSDCLNPWPDCITWYLSSWC